MWKSGSFPCHVYICLWMCLLICLTVIWLAGKALESMNTHTCAIAVGSCAWFPCSDAHGEKTSCHKTVCMCDVGTCAPDGYICADTTEMNRSCAKTSCTIRANNVSVTYDRLQHARAIEATKDDIEFWIQPGRVGFVVVLMFILAVIGYIVIMASKGETVGPLTSFDRWFENLLRERIFKKTDGENLKDKPKDEKKTKGKEADPDDAKEKDTDDIWLLLWFFTGEFLIVAASGYALNVNSDAISCHHVEAKVGMIGFALVMLSFVHRDEWALPGYSYSWGGDINDDEEKHDVIYRITKKRRKSINAKVPRLNVPLLLETNGKEQRRDTDPKEGQSRAGNFACGGLQTFFQVLVRFVGYNCMMSYGFSRHFFLTLLCMIMEILHRGFFRMIYLVDSKLWKRRVKLINKQIWKNEAHDSNQKTPKVKISIEPSNVYIDLTQPFMLKTFMRFCGQLVLTCAYVFGLHDELPPLTCGDRGINFHKVVMWTSGVIVQILLSEQMGQTWFDNIFNWFLIYTAKPENIHSATLDALDQKAPSRDDDDQTLDVKEIELWDVTLDQISQQDYSFAKLYGPFVKLRCLMSYFVNFVIFTLVLQTVPWTLVVEDDAMDFVKDCIAVGFLCTLDDVSDAVAMVVTLTGDEDRVESLQELPCKRTSSTTQIANTDARSPQGNHGNRNDLVEKLKSIEALREKVAAAQSENQTKLTTMAVQLDGQRNLINCMSTSSVVK